MSLMREIRVSAMLLGAFVGALLALRVSLAAPLAVAVAVLVLVAGAAHALSRSRADWTQPPL
jgi:uncharacterized membrane protein YoaK (UPF0700 family)